MSVSNGVSADNTQTSQAEAALLHVNRTIDAYFSANIVEARTISDSYALLWHELQRLILSGGKRLRPRMVCLAYQAFGGKDLARVAPVAAATELFHLSILIHDDIIDRDTVRYGVPNIIGGYLDHYTPLIQDRSERLHYAESAALLGGDVLLSGAHELIAGAALEPATKSEVQRLFSRSVFEVAGGELIDTEAAFQDPDKVDPLNIARYKTAGYSFISPLLIGAALAGADTVRTASLRQFAEQLGIAFQLQDDLLGMFGDSQVLGKSTIGDIREGKRTYMIVCFEKQAAAADRRVFNRYFGKPDVSGQEAVIIRDLLLASGARSQVEVKIKQLEAQAITALAQMQLSPEYYNQFIELITKSLKRNF